MSQDTVDDAWERLLLARTQGDARPLEADPHPLVELYRPLVAAGSRLVVAQLGQSIDGFIASRDGGRESVTGPEDHVHLHRLRALVDVVVVGVGTALADDPRLTVRHVRGPQPVRVVLDPRGRAPADLTVFTDGAAPTVWVVGEGVRPSRPPEGAEVLALPCGPAGVDESRLVRVLAERGLGRVLVEGGGVTVSRFLAAGVLDRLYVTVTPMLVGDGRPGLRFRGPERLEHALRPHTRCFPLGSDVLFEMRLR